MRHTSRPFDHLGLFAFAAALAVLGAALVGCDMMNQDSAGSAGMGGSGLGLAAPAAKPDESADQPYSILLCMFTDPERHIQDAEYYQQSLTNNLKWKGVFVVNKAGVSELFWGRYGSPAAAQANLRIAKAHRTQTGTQPFSQAFVVPLPGKDIGPAAWNLRNAKGLYTLLLATFQDDPSRNYVGRKKFALDYCKRLRDGGYEAYFYHGPVISLVTVGLYGADAVSHQSGNGPGGGIESYLLTDPKVKALQRDFPYLAINGNTESQVSRNAKGNTVSTPKKTALIQIPREESAAGELGGSLAPAKPTPSAAAPGGAANNPTQTPATPEAPPAAPAKYRSEALP